MIALDTNLLVYAHRAAVDEHASARQAIEKAVMDGRGCGIGLPSIVEFWSIVTNPRIGKRPSATDEALTFIQKLVTTAGIEVWIPGRGFHERLMQLAVDTGVKGKRIFDLQIALVAIENGASEIWTHDVDFVRIPGLRLRDPLGGS